MTSTTEAPGAPRPPATRRRQSISLLVLAVLALACGLALTQPGTPRSLVALAGVLLALGLPGIAVTRAMFPGRGMGQAERIVLIIGIQFALVILSGFLLQLLPSGLSPATWGDILADITLLGCAVAWLRGRTLAPDDRVALANAPAPAPGWLTVISKLPTSQLAMLIGAVMVAGLALALARAGVAWQPQPAWTALAIEPTDAGRAVAVEVTNAEGRPETYRLVATLDGEPLTSVDGLVVDSGGSVSQTIPLPAAGAFLRRVDVSLWRSGEGPDAAPYRSVRLSLRGVPGR